MSIKILSSVMESYKKKIFDDFNFTSIETIDKEIGFVSVYFIFNQLIDSAVFKERIDAVTEKDVNRVYQKYFKNFAWSVMSSDSTIKNLSQDFFTNVQQ